MSKKDILSLKASGIKALALRRLLYIRQFGKAFFYHGNLHLITGKEQLRDSIDIEYSLISLFGILLHHF